MPATTGTQETSGATGFRSVTKQVRSGDMEIQDAVDLTLVNLAQLENMTGLSGDNKSWLYGKLNARLDALRAEEAAQS